MSDSMTHFYIPRLEQTEENLFTEEYYSSTDTKIFMDDVEQSEISYISYSLREQLKPIYGYSSYTFDEMAIGNRIVTGTFKVPIKNPNAQTQQEEIMKANNLQITDFIQEYNEEQQMIMDNVAWIAPNGDIINVEDKISSGSNEFFEYKAKLIYLGYDLDYNSDYTTVSNQVKEFQKDNSLYAHGLFTAETMSEIDRKISEKSLSSMHLPEDTKIYLIPSNKSSYHKILKPQDAYIKSMIKDSDNNEIAYIITKEKGIEGYVYIKEVDV